MTDVPPPPGLPQAPLASAETLKVGDVVQIAVQLLDKNTGQPFWWKRFAVVTRPGRGHHREFEALTLKMHPNLDRRDRSSDYRLISLSTDERERPQVVTKLREPYPQGVQAMWVKALTKGWFKMED